MFNINIERFIVGGDWNIILQLIDKKGGILWKFIIVREKFFMMMNEFVLVDIFRE